MNINEPAVFLERLTQKSTVTEILLEVPGISEGRLQIQLRIPLPNTKVSLIDPSGRIVVTAKDLRTVVQQRKYLQQPDLGDLVLLPEQRDPLSGMWRLHLTHPPAGGGEHVTVTAGLLSRFSLV